MKSFALSNIKKHQKQKRSDLLKEIGYHALEVLTALGIFALGFAFFSMGL